MGKMTRRLGIVVLLAMMFAFSATALAATKPPAYQGEGGNVQAPVDVAGEDVETVGQLPFTGLDLAIFALVALALLVSGASMYRIARRRS